MTTTITHLMNRFTSLTRTVNPDGSHTLDAIDDQGRAWWLIVGNDEAPGSWTELLPLPQATVDKPISPLAGAWVERVGVALAIADVENVAWNRERCGVIDLQARAAIRVVAEWLRSHGRPGSAETLGLEQHP